MEVDDTPTASTSGSSSSANNKSVVMASTPDTAGVSGSLTLALHPLVVMNISEHWTRTKAQEGQPKKVYGAIIGKHQGRFIEIMNSFELHYNELEGKVIIDRDYYNLKESQFKQVFPDMDFLGWYSTGEAPTQNEIEIQRQMCEIDESPIFLLLNPAARHTDLPVSIYESIVDLIGGETRMLFVKLNYSLATEEAERIGLDHVAKISGGSDDNQSKVSQHVAAHHSAIKMLESRVRIILDYVKAVETGEIKHNHEIMREIKALVDRLPVLEGGRFSPEFYSQCNDGALLTYLGVITKSSANLNQFINKVNLLNQKQGAGRRMRGLFY